MDLRHIHLSMKILTKKCVNILLGRFTEYTPPDHVITYKQTNHDKRSSHHARRITNKSIQQSIHQTGSLGKHDVDIVPSRMYILWLIYLFFIHYGEDCVNAVILLNHTHTQFSTKELILVTCL